MTHTILSTAGNLVCHSVRLRRGDDLLLSIKDLARQKHIRAGVVLSAVGCISKGRVRDASGVTIRNITVESYGYNNDGVNPDSCKYVVIDGCHFKTGGCRLCSIIYNFIVIKYITVCLKSK